MKMCKSCADGEIYDVPADFYVQGKDSDGKPYSGYLCEDHLSIMLEDGAVFPIQTKLSGKEGK